ncbi:DUF309 domain-containing protein [Halobacteriales archaeon QH_10_67_13]|nr:MAG: DUF309 domain-containing protein [Halobacteriales archaeon QH_10_67_13]
MNTPLRAGAAVYNDGAYRWAAEVWDTSGGRPDGADAPDASDVRAAAPADQGTRLLDGLAVTAGAIAAARARDWSAARDRAGRGMAALDGSVPEAVVIAPVCAYLATLQTDPAVIERRRSPPVVVAGDRLARSDLGFEATALAARALATLRGDDIERAIAYASEDVAEETVSSPFVTLVFDYVRDADHRGLIVERLTQHADRRQAKDDDVAGLFDRS